ncbi:MAG: response regulator transcription factor [Ignavibacteriales bacterium]|nr:MAG: response regulator transcription factor [Ignavibacteriales bacterium]
MQDSPGHKSISIVEPNKFIKSAFEFLLQNESWIKLSGSFISIEEFANSDSSAVTDILICDLKDIASDEFLTVRSLRIQFPSMTIAAATTTNYDGLIIRAIINGVSGYVSKTTSGKEFLNALKFIASGYSPVTPQLAGGISDFIKKSRLYSNLDSCFLLYEEETLLAKFAEGKSFSTIAEELGTTVGTIGKEIRNLYNKVFKIAELKRSANISFKN